MLAQIGMGGSPAKLLLLLAVVVGYVLSFACEIVALAFLSVSNPKLRTAAIALALCGGALPTVGCVWAYVSFPAMWFLYPIASVMLIAPALLCILALVIARARARSPEA